MPSYTVVPCIMDTRLIQTSHYYGQLNKVEVAVDSLLCPWDLEALTFSLNLTLLIQTAR